MVDSRRATPDSADRPEPTARYQLDELRVRNLGVIDDVTLTFGPGMTVLTGETGAGKTLVVEALGLLLGRKADPSVVRAGEREALVEARFVGSVAAAPDRLGGAPGPDGDSEIVLSRSIVSGGRSRARINGRMAPLEELATLGDTLVELHGQRLHRSLVHAAAQRRALDDYGGVDRTELDAARVDLDRLIAEARSLGGDAAQRAREEDLLRYQLAEIDGAGIEDPGEDTRLEEEEDRLAAASSHRHAAAAALRHLDGTDPSGAMDLLAAAAGELAGRPPLGRLEERVKAVMADLSDLAMELRGVVDTWEDDPERLEAVRRRRQLLHELQRKYGEDLSAVTAFAEELRGRLAALVDQEARSARLEGDIAVARARLESAQRAVAAARRNAAPALAAEIEATLRGLAMGSARFDVTVEGGGAGDQVTFWLGANPGEPALPLAKAASGGELARTMLAVRLALTATAGVLVFDEVDAGVGGEAATAVGAALATLGRRAQVLVVTHLAQVAAQADQQWTVRKTEGDGRTRSVVEQVVGEDRVVELSRMLSGSPDSRSAREHARELLGGGGPASGGAPRPRARQP